MAITRVVIPENLNPDHFNINTATNLIDVKFEVAGGGSGTISELKFDESTKKITWKDNGQVKEHDMSAFLTDVHVKNASLTAGILKLESEGQPTITVDLNALSATNIVTANNANVQMIGKGTTAEPLSVSLNTGVMFATELQDAFANPIGKLYSGS